MVQNAKFEDQWQANLDLWVGFCWLKIEMWERAQFCEKNSDAAKNSEPTADFIKGQHISRFLPHSTEVFLEGLTRWKLEQQKYSSNDNSSFLPSAMGVILHRGFRRNSSTTAGRRIITNETFIRCLPYQAEHTILSSQPNPFWEISHKYQHFK